MLWFTIHIVCCASFCQITVRYLSLRMYFHQTSVDILTVCLKTAFTSKTRKRDLYYEDILQRRRRIANHSMAMNMKTSLVCFSEMHQSYMMLCIVIREMLNQKTIRMQRFLELNGQSYPVCTSVLLNGHLFYRPWRVPPLFAVSFTWMMILQQLFAGQPFHPQGQLLLTLRY